MTPVDQAIHEAPIHTLSRADTLVRLEAQKQMRGLQAQYGAMRLEPYGFRVYSQHDEDGIIQEIFRRIGTTCRRFVEFGAGIGIESNCAYLLLQGWSGVWADGNPKYVETIQKTFEHEIAAGRLTAFERMVTIENVDELVGARDLDLLSIDVDGNDYHLWEAVKSRPRVVVIEYNAAFPPPARVVQPYQPELVWGGTTYYGASLSALEDLAKLKGYVLVGTNITGVNAFFVRDDVLWEKNEFSDAGKSKSASRVLDPTWGLYNPARYRLGEFGFDGHRAGWGKW